MRWQDIATAPRDREILVWNAVTGSYRTQWTNGQWPMGFWGWLGEWYPQPVLWANLPVPAECDVRARQEVDAPPHEPCPIYRAGCPRSPNPMGAKS